jgi:hypothetical protein
LIHRTHGHPDRNRMLKIALAMDSADPHRPKLNTLTKWILHRKCPFCVTGAMRRPPANKEHPALPRRQDIDNGEGLHIDCLGTFPGPAIGGHTDAFLFTDDHSSIRVAFPTHSKSCVSLLENIKTYVATSQVSLKFIRTDNEFVCEPLLSWCRENKVQLSACAPHTHVQNPKAERSVGRVKETMRKDKHQAATLDYLLPYAYMYACQSLNRQPTSADPTGDHRSPLQIWPSAPFQHPAQRIFPWGCHTFGFLGKRTDAPNTGMRASPGIYIGHASMTSGHLLYHPDSDSVLTYGYVTAHERVFPIKDQQLAGELHTKDASFDTDSWRRHSIYAVADVSDYDTAQFGSGKQVHFLVRLPGYSGLWQVRSHRPVRSTTDIVGLEVEFVKYLGPASDLKTKLDREYKTRPVLSIFPMSPVTPAALPKGWYTTDVRSCLRDTYPTCRTLAQIATDSVSLAGAYPAPKALADASRRESVAATASSSLQAPPPSFPVGRVVLPVRRIGSVRNHRSTWFSSPHHILPCRQHVLVSSSTSLSKSPRPLQPANVLLLSATGPVGYCPRSYRDARSHDSWPQWDAAIHKEISGLEARQTWHAIHESDVPDGACIMDSKFVFTDKATGAKVRVVVRGDQQWPPSKSADTYAPTPPATEIRMLAALAAANNWGLHSMDISQAFVQADPLDPATPFYVRPPRGYACSPGTIWKLHKPLYGLACAPKAWSTTLVRFLIDYGFAPVNGSSTCFKWTDGSAHMHLVFHVDDILLTFSDDAAAVAFKSALLTRFAGTDDGPVTRYVGMDFFRDSHHIHLSQEPLALDLLERFDMLHCNPCANPMDAGELLLESDRPSVPDVPLRRQYQECVGTLQYLATWTRPDLQFCTNELSKHMSNPGIKHWQAAKRVLRYLKGTVSLGLTYTRGLSDPNRLIAYADADWATCTETRRSISAFVVLLNGAAIAWKSKKQGAVATSSSEAEFVSASKAADELVWERRLLADLGFPQPGPTPLHEDNRACKLLSQNPVHSERSKHIDFRVHALRERVATGEVVLVDCASRDMVADSLTKNLPVDAFLRHRDVQLGRLHQPCKSRVF